MKKAAIKRRYNEALQYMRMLIDEYRNIDEEKRADIVLEMRKTRKELEELAAIIYG